jgi:hypothetical protein
MYSAAARAFLSVLLAILACSGALAWEPVPVRDDPLVRMPGTQPADGVALESPNRCLNCHAGYNPAVEPGFNWSGSMMAQAARDPLYWATLAVAAQDSIWATGRPNATDICLRCHLPKGWLEGRSDPTNASAMTGDDFDGVQCDFCHRNYDAFHADTAAGTREGGDFEGYWDESNQSDTPSGTAADQTLAADRSEAGALTLFGNKPDDVRPMLGPDGRPVEGGYTESGAGQYFVATDAAKRASFADAAARHQMHYSRYHKSKYFCSSCHDVSNPVLANLEWDGSSSLPTETAPAYSYFHVERTFSEFMLSAYGQQGGAAGIGPFAPDVFDTSLPGNLIGKCQDCHMRDVVGAGANKKGSPVRPGDSTEHPQSGQPLHDLTGGNVWVSTILASAVPGSPNANQVNHDLLNQGAQILTMDLVSGQGVNPEAMLAGADRAMQQLQLAASIDAVNYDPVSGDLSFRIQNRTGHKLISGYPEGRRMFVNIRAYLGETLIYEVNPYDTTAATLKGLEDYAYTDPYPDGQPLPAPESLTDNETHLDELVYEAQMSSVDLTLESHTFHFALATDRAKDNRIPPQGFRIEEAVARLATPVVNGAVDKSLYTPEEYAGGYDAVSLQPLVAGADRIEISLYYQTTSREYVTFLSDEIDGRASTLPPEAYVAQSDPFFAGLKAWGETIWRLWKNNRDQPGAAPILMASAATGGGGGGGGGCAATTPTLLSADASHSRVDLTWSDEHSGNAEIIGYGLFYDQAGKALSVADLGTATAYADTGLTDGETYCYKVTSRTAECESAYSNILCATPEPNVQSVAGVDELVTGELVTTGKGKDKQTEFVPKTVFAPGETVVVRAHLVDATGQPLTGGSASIQIVGPEGASLSTGASDANGHAFGQWSTAAPRNNGRGGTATGQYTARTAGLTASGYVWDGAATETVFQLQ